MSENKSSSLPLATIILLIIALICAILALLVKNHLIKLPESWLKSTQTISLVDSTPTPLPEYATPSAIIIDPDQELIPASALVQAPPDPTAAPPAPPAPPPKPTETNTATPVPQPTSPTQAQAPTTTPKPITKLDGTLYLQETIPQNAEVLLLVRPIGQSDYQTIKRFPAQATLHWVWPEATLGQKYEVAFALQVNQKNIHTSPVGTAKAPATINIWMNTAD